MKNNRILLRIVVSILLLGWLSYQVDFSLIGSTLLKSKLYWIFASILFGLINVVISSRRIQYILMIYHLKVSVIYLVKLYLIGNFYNNFLPTQMGGDVYKAYQLSKSLKRYKNKGDSTIPGYATFAIFMDRFSGLIVLYIISIFGLFFTFGTMGLLIAVLLLAACYIIYFLGIKYLSHKIKIVQKFKEANEIFIQKENRKKSLNIFITAIFVQIFAIFTQVFCFYAIGIDLPLGYAFLYIPIITVMGLIPSINGLGIQDYGFVFFFSQLSVGLTSEHAFAASILYHAVRLTLSFVGGVILFFEKDYVKLTN